MKYSFKNFFLLYLLVTITYVISNFILLFSSGKESDVVKEAFLDPIELISLNGYKGETHFVNTQDGYKLVLHRIPFGKHKKTPGIPVLITHSLLCTSASWIDNLDDSLGFILADEGFDVWLGNIRGNEGTEHVCHGYDDAEFWDFSWEEIVEYDLTAFIDYVRNETKYEKILYIGESVGTLIGFALFSKPEYDNKIAGFIAMSPILNVHYLTSLSARSLVYSFKVMNILYHHFGVARIQLFPKYFRKTIATICTFPYICDFFYTILTGYSRDVHNSTRLPVYFYHCSEPFSLKTLLHGHQVQQSQILAKFDYGKSKNLEKYGSINPPIYNASKITTPIALFTGANDPYATPINVQLTARNLSNVIALEIIPEKLFNHVNFMWSHPARELIYDKTIAILKRMWDLNGKR